MAEHYAATINNLAHLQSDTNRLAEAEPLCRGLLGRSDAMLKDIGLGRSEAMRYACTPFVPCTADNAAGERLSHSSPAGELGYRYSKHNL